MIDLVLYTAPNCASCKLVSHELKKRFLMNEHVNFILQDITKENPQKVKIVPAFYVGNILYAYGEFDYDKFEDRIRDGYIEKLVGKKAS